MLYLFESEFPKNKSIFISFLQVFGIGKFNSILICKQLGFSVNLKTKNLSKEQINKIIKIFEFLNLQITSDLKKLKALVLKKQILIRCYKGLRKLKGLPVRGQRTHTNRKTAKKLLKNMSIFLLIKKKKIINKIKNKVEYTLFYKEQLKYLKTTHSYHLVDASP